MIKRQPGDGAVALTDRQPVLSDSARIGHEGALRDGDAGREAGAAGGKLQIAQRVFILRRQVAGNRRYRLQRFQGSGEFKIESLGGLKQPGRQHAGAEQGIGARCFQHPPQMGDIVLAAAKGRRQGHRRRDQPGILAGIEGAGKIAVVFSDQADPVTRLQAGAQHFPGRKQGLLAQLGVGQRLGHGQFSVIEIDAGGPQGRIVKGFCDGPEISVAFRQAGIGRRRRVNHYGESKLTLFGASAGNRDGPVLQCSASHGEAA